MEQIEGKKSVVNDYCFFFSSRRRHTRLQGDWSSDVCSSDLARGPNKNIVPNARWGRVIRCLTSPPSKAATLWENHLIHHRVNMTENSQTFVSDL